MANDISIIFSIIDLILANCADLYDIYYILNWKKKKILNIVFFI